MVTGPSEIEQRFGFHRATEKTGPMHAAMRLRYRDHAEYLDLVLPDSREKSLALTALQEASMWTHAAIAMQAPLVSD